ncbi:MAG: hypothetical protein WCH59_08160 [Chitinophagia bacterium]|jgi:hypothetical protein
MAKKHLYFFVLTFYCVGNLHAQNDSVFNAFKNKVQSQMENFRSENKKKFDGFRSRIDSIYFTYLKNSWASFEALLPVQGLKKPKPQSVPTADNIPKDKPPRITTIPISKNPELPPPSEVTPPATAPLPTPVNLPPRVVEPPVATPPPATKPLSKNPTIDEKPASTLPSYNKPSPSGGPAKQSLLLQFYGIRFDIPTVDIKTLPRLTGEIDQIQIANFWKSASEADLQRLIQSVNIIPAEIGGGFYAMQRALLTAILKLYSNDADSTHKLNNATLLCWYLLLQNGYDVKIGFRKSKVLLLINMKPEVYGISYYRLGEKLYYLLPEETEAGMLQICSLNYPGEVKSCSFDVSPALSQPADSNKIQFRKFSFQFQNKPQQIELAYFPSHIQYYEQYPQMGFGNYRQSEEVALFNREVKKAFSEKMKFLSETEKVQYLLSFAQSFPYKTDQQQFGKEKWMFPQEAIYYPYLDCDDRSILFSYLVTLLTDLPVIGLLYPDHICTAVAFNSTVVGTSLMWKGKKYTVCDPTYINSSIGMSMPQYDGVAAKIVE